MVAFIRSTSTLPGVMLHRLLVGRFAEWASRSAWHAGLVLAGISYFVAFPSYDVAVILHEMDANWDALFTQVAAPFTDHSTAYRPDTHESKLAFRFVPALLLRALGARSLGAALLVQIALIPVLHALLFRLFRDLTHDRRLAFVLAFPFCFVIAGHVHASDYRGIFDSLALSFLLLAAIMRHRAWVILAILLAAFTDERALVATPVLLLLDLYISGHTSSLTKIISGLMSRPCLLVFSAWLAYFALRIVLGQLYDLRTPPIDLVQYLVKNHARACYALYIGLEGYLIVAVGVMIALLRKKAHAFAWLVLASFLASWSVAMCVIDINRSLSYLILFIALITLILVKERPISVALGVLGWALIISSLYDDFYPLPLQLYRMALITETLSPLKTWIMQ